MVLKPVFLIFSTSAAIFSTELMRFRLAVASIHRMRACSFWVRAVCWASPTWLLASSSRSDGNCGKGRYGGGGVGGGTVRGAGPGGDFVESSVYSVGQLPAFL